MRAILLHLVFPISIALMYGAFFLWLRLWVIDGDGNPRPFTRWRLAGFIGIPILVFCVVADVLTNNWGIR